MGGEGFFWELNKKIFCAFCVALSVWKISHEKSAPLCTFRWILQHAAIKFYCSISCFFFFNFFSCRNAYSFRKIAQCQNNGTERFYCLPKRHSSRQILVEICIRTFWPVVQVMIKVGSLVKMTNGASNERMEFQMVKLTKRSEEQINKGQLRGIIIKKNLRRIRTLVLIKFRKSFHKL